MVAIIKFDCGGKISTCELWAMHDARNACVVEVRARTATKKYQKVRIGAGIGSQLGVFCSSPISLLEQPLASIWCRLRRTNGVNISTTFQRDFSTVSLAARARYGLDQLIDKQEVAAR